MSVAAVGNTKFLGRRHTPATLEKMSHPVGTTVVGTNGYRRIKTEDGYRAEHRVVAGLVPGDGLISHHDDGNKLNNDPANLRVMTNSEHGRLHALAKTQ